MKLQKKSKYFLWALPIYWVALFIATHMPKIPNWVRSSSIPDYSLHYLAYFCLTFFIWNNLALNEKISWKKPKVWIIISFMVWYCAVDEWLQAYVGRTPQLRDYFADMAGVMSGLLIMTLCRFWMSSFLYIVLGSFTLSFSSKLSTMFNSVKLNSTFNFCVLALLTIVWMQIITPYKSNFKSQIKWFFKAISAPLIYLTTLFAVNYFVHNKDIYIIDIIIGLAGMFSASLAGLLGGLFIIDEDENEPESCKNNLDIDEINHQMDSTEDRQSEASSTNCIGS